jgi:WD40 repeat protein
VESGQHLVDFPVSKPEGGLTPEFSPDGKILAVGHRNSSTRLFDVANGKMLHELPLRMSHELKFDPTGKVLAIVYVDGSVALWNAESGKLIKRVPTAAKELYSIDWSPDGRLLATSGMLGSVSIWNADDLSLLTELEAPDWVIRVRFEPSGSHLVFCGGSRGASSERYFETWAVP